MSKKMSDNSVAERLRKKGIEKWEIENSADTLIKAEEIKNNKDLMKAVAKVMKKRKEAIDSVKI